MLSHLCWLQWLPRTLGPLVAVRGRAVCVLGRLQHEFAFCLHDSTFFLSALTPASLLSNLLLLCTPSFSRSFYFPSSCLRLGGIRTPATFGMLASTCRITSLLQENA